MWSEYGRYSCKAYESCPDVEFTPDTRTLVTDWGLACDRGWTISTILSIRMAGYLFSMLIVGYIGDRFGRRLPFLVTRIIMVILNLISFFSVSWQMYAAVSFFMGFFGSYGLLLGVTINEYVAPGWRVKIAALPTWSIMSMMVTGLAMLIKDWRTMRLIATIGLFVMFFPLILFVPESLRWISIKGTKEDVVKMIEKIAKINKSGVPDEAKINAVVEKNMQDRNAQNYTIAHLFRKGYRIPTLVIGFICFSVDIVYFAFHFGVPALPGNFYTNLIIFSATDLPVTFVAFFFANKFERKPTTIVTFGLCALCIFGIVAVDLTGSGQLKEIGTVALVMTSKFFLYIAWVVLSTSIIELYPTVVRSTVGGFRAFCASMGGVVAPYLIPTDPTTFYICYLAMAVLCTVCTGLIFLFPETKGQPMKDTWEDDDKRGDGLEMAVKVEKPEKPMEGQQAL